jgi:dTDP-4-dehydrorhamnose 3,5-epimerase
MRFDTTGLAGAWIVRTEPHADTRGRFGRIYCKHEFDAHGLTRPLVQASLSFNRARGTVRGLHFQWPPSREAKLIRCVRGAVFDVIVDLRPDSRTFLRHLAVELTEDNQVGLYVPEGFAHGFQALRDDSELLYQMTDFYAPDLSTGFRFDDPAFALEWPGPVTEISDRDRAAEAFDRELYTREYLTRMAAGST